MGGVDVHDQLRLQTYSLLMSTKFKKYYKSLFLGVVDMGLNQLLQLKLEDFGDVVATPPPSGQKRKRPQLQLTPAVEQSNDWVIVTGVQKRRQRLCKVCALLRADCKKISFATTFFCKRCSIDDAKCWLCNKIRRQYKGVAKTCFEIWHDDFDCGQNLPATLGKRVVLQRPGKKAGAHKKTRRKLELREGER
ncbi:hypothetical protein F443_00576 [Phytophthora nicotianae P1569]|uniref:PiggyBac transposable element-derived protein domain-containing protein n=1 Tax=Phytophthora nicotianae P1569 TaxID=1317065 RepID=V9G1Z4_PHYNI|nr:hypothetical protein F443_00576 [Phytophthora nicotianae P1569]